MVRRVYEVFNQVAEFDLRDFDPDVVVDNPNAALDGAVHRGHDGLRESLSLLRTMWQRQRLEPQEFISVDEDRFVVPMRMISVGRNEVETVAQAAMVYTLHDGRITHPKAFQGNGEAVRLGE